MAPGDDIEGVQQEENADERDPDGAAKGAEEPELVARGAVVCDAGAGVGHPADEEPDAEADEEEGNQPVNGKGMEQPRVADEKEAAESDEPDGSGRETVTHGSEIRVSGIGGGSGITGGSVGWNGRRDGAVPGRGAPTCARWRRGIGGGGGGGGACGLGSVGW